MMNNFSSLQTVVELSCPCPGCCHIGDEACQVVSEEDVVQPVPPIQGDMDVCVVFVVESRC